MSIGVALYGKNGHQIQGKLLGNPRADLVGVAAMEPGDLEEQVPGLRKYGSLSDVLADDDVEVVSLCSPRRGDHAGQILECLAAGLAQPRTGRCPIILHSLLTHRRIPFLFDRVARAPGRDRDQTPGAARRRVRAARAGQECGPSDEGGGVMSSSVPQSGVKQTLLSRTFHEHYRMDMVTRDLALR